MVSRTGGDLWFWCEWTLHGSRSIRTASQGISRGVDNDGIDLEARMNLFAQFDQTFSRVVSGLQAEIRSDFVSFFLVQTQDHVEIFLKRRNKFQGVGDGRPISVGWMQGRSRPFHVTIPYASPRTALAIAFNDKCDVVVATVVAEESRVPAAENAAMAFLNGDLVLRWAEKELGL